MNVDLIQDCPFSADIVEYMYGEMPISRSLKFEAHLADCALCIEEFAVVSEARFEVYEWRKMEFAPMETPEIVIPYRSAARRDPVGDIPWYRKLSEVFSFSPGLAAAATCLVAVTIASGVIFFAMRGDEPHVVAVPENREIPVASVRKPEETGEIEYTPVRPDTGSGERRKAEEREATVERERTVPQRTAVRTPQRNSVKRSVNTTIQAVRSRVPERQPSRPSLRLNEFDDDEDGSLRLAQLFEDIETSD